MEITLILNTVLLFAQPVAVVLSSVTHVLELPVQSFNYLIVVIVVKSTCSFRGAFTTGVACQQGTFTLLDTWFRPPFGNCLCSNCPKFAVSFPDFSLWILGTFSILLNQRDWAHGIHDSNHVLYQHSFCTLYDISCNVSPVVIYLVIQ